MSFLNPWVLSAMAAAGIPVAIHFLNKFRVKKTRWAAMRFVRDSLHQNRRRLQMEDLLLLLLRCLILVVLALAFAQPVLRTLAPGNTNRDLPSTTVVLLDHSASMGQSNGIETRFEEGKRDILRTLERASPGSRFALFLVSDRIEKVIARPETDLARFRRSLELASLGDRSTDLLLGMQAAATALKSIEANQKEVLIFTDSQLSAWPGEAEIEALRHGNPGITFRPMVLGDRGENNLAVTHLAVEGGIPAEGQPSRIRVQVTNNGTEAADRIRVTLSLDREVPCDEAVLDRIEPGASRTADLFARFPRAGFHALTASIPPDRLPIDNQRSVAVRVAAPLEVLVVEGREAGTTGSSDGFFLANALAPVSPLRRQDHYLRVKTTAFSSLPQTPLDGFHTVFLSNPPSPSEAVARALQAYVHQGGNLVIFPGEATLPQEWNASPLAAILPAELGARRESPANPATLQADGFDHPITAIWNDEAEGRLGSVGYTTWFPLILKTAEPPAAAILRLANGDIAAAEWTADRGRVVLFNGPATPDGNTLPLHPGFVGLMQRLMGFLHRGTEGALALRPGAIFEAPVAMELLGRDFSVSRPGESHEPRAAGRVELSDHQAVVRYRDTEAVGFYEVFIAPDERPVAAFAVQFDPAESNLRQAPPAELQVLAQVEDSVSTPMSFQVKKEYWTVLILLAATLVLAETILSHRLSWSR